MAAKAPFSRHLWLRCFLLLFLIPWPGFSSYGLSQQPGQEAQAEKESAPEEPELPEEKEKTEPKEGAKVKLAGGGFDVQPGGMNLHVSTGKSASSSSTPGKDTKRYEFAGAPIPIINPTVGNGLAGAGMVAIHLNPKDTVSPPSVFGGGVVFTDNGTRAWGLVSELFLNKDRFRILGVLVDGRINYDYYGNGHESGQDGLYVPLSMDAFAFLIEPKVRVFEKWYVGPRYHLLDSTVELDREKLREEFPGLPVPPVDVPPLDLEVRSAALGLRIQRDSRDNQFCPRKGSFFHTKLDFFNTAFGSTRDYEKIDVGYQGYVGFKGKNVLAYRGAVCSASGDAPFYSLCLFGQSQDVRGYAVGQYQDLRMLVGQVEYRRELFWRLGAVAYFGAGEVAPSFSDFSWKNILPGGGIGARITLAKENHINFRIDYAWGKDNKALYIGIIEAF